MALRDVEYQEDYRSGYDNIVKEFLGPSLREAETYWRAVGYFRSSALQALGESLGEFVKNGGTVRLVTSVELTEDDLRAISKGAGKEEICSERLASIIDTEFAEGVGTGVARLARLLEWGRLEVKIAVPKSGTGVYHEKIGLFFQGQDYVAFTGSSNESHAAFENNRECVDVYSSWRDPIRAARKRSHFEALWAMTDPGVDVYPFPEAAKKRLLRIAGVRASDPARPRAAQNKWRHQQDAVRCFLAAQRGVLDMATGTGKTRTALQIRTELIDAERIDTTIVCTEGNDLLDQWFAELLAERRRDSNAHRIFRQYRHHKQLQDFTLEPTRAVLLVSRRYVGAALRRLRPGEGARTLLVHDEVHGLGSPANRTELDGLSDHIRFRLGLSATPEREYDEEGNEFVERHIGPVLYTFGLEDAIRRGILAPFRYHALSYEPGEEDKRRIAAVYKRKKAREMAGDPMSDQELYIELARVHKTSTAKLPVFLDFIREHQELLTRCIVFVETMEYGDAVLDLIHQFRSDFHTYFSEEDSDVLHRFARNDLQCLITCHRLSEGIDIRTLDTVILFSSARARLETIQRIGRCLRTNPDDPQKVANVVDFIRDVEDGPEQNADEGRRLWLSEISAVVPRQSGETYG